MSCCSPASGVHSLIRIYLKILLWRLLYTGHCLRASLTLIYVILATRPWIDTISMVLTSVRETGTQSGWVKNQTVAPTSTLLAMKLFPSEVIKPSLGEAVLVGTPLWPPPTLLPHHPPPFAGIPRRDIFAGVRAASHPFLPAPAVVAVESAHWEIT